MGKYVEDAKKLLVLIGGRENIAAVSHCMTRMRFVLNEPEKAQVKEIEALKSVKGSFTQTGQFQVIIGNSVGEFYNDFVAIAGVEGVSKENLKDAAKQNQTWLQRLVAVLAEIFAPLIPAIITGGLILGFRNCIDSLYIFENGTKTLCDLSQFWSGVDSFLWLIGEAVFHMLPVGICWSVTKKMGTTQILGIILGLTLVSGQLLNAYAVATTAATDIPVWDFGFFKLNMIGYQAQVIPAMLAAFSLVYLEKFFRKITPQAISMIVVPFFSLTLAVILSHAVLGPIGWKIGSAVSAVVYAGITGPVKIAFAAVFGGFYAPLVITGLHHMSNAIDLQLIADYQGTMLWPMIALSNIAQGSAVLAMTLLQKKNADAQEVNVPACISCYLGVTEPAIFGVNLKYGFPFVCGMIGSAAASVVCVAFGTTANAIGVGGLPGILSIRLEHMPVFAVCMLIAIVIPVILTVIIGRKKLSMAERGMSKDANAVENGSDMSNHLDAAENGNDGAKDADAAENDSDMSNDADAAANDSKNWVAYASGQVIPLADVNDGVFSAGMMGDGIAIIPENDVLYAPCDGKVLVVMEDSGHACGLSLPNGKEVLLHIGIDTVKMNGDGFNCLVKVGQEVKAGDALIEFSRNKILAAGCRTEIICAVTEEGDAPKMKFKTYIAATATKTVVTEDE